jgi:uncharacterized lipoprotein YehR (DUF1307 family)
MLEQYKDFDVKHFTKTFNSSKYYNGNINGFDIMAMQSHEDADKLINELKQVINSFSNIQRQTISLEYDDSHLLDSDKIRVKQEIKKYATQRFA